MSLHDLACEIADNGGWEEFHQKRRNFTMYDHHKARRLKLQRQYKTMKEQLNAPDLPKADPSIRSPSQP